MIQKIRLLIDLPVADEHGMTRGRICDAETEEISVRGGVRWWVVGDIGTDVGVLGREAEAVTENADST